MDVDEFKSRATDPEEWYYASRALRQSADTLFDEAGQRQVDHSLERNDELSDDEYFSEEFIAHQESAMLLTGLAIETALKGWIIEHKPSEIEIGVEFKVDGSGAYHDEKVEIEKIGPSLKRGGHKLKELAGTAGIYNEDLYGEESKMDRLKEVLDHLSEVVKWGGRYPLPKKLKDRREWEKTASKISLVYLLDPRELTDPLLDHLLNDRP